MCLFSLVNSAQNICSAYTTGKIFEFTFRLLYLSQMYSANSAAYRDCNRVDKKTLKSETAK